MCIRDRCMSTFTLAAIAVNRFMAVFYPFSTRANSLRRTVLIILCLDLVAITIGLPKAVIFEQIPRKYKKTDPEWKFQGGMYCSSTWPDKWHDGYNSFIKVSQFAIPFTIIIVCYTSIIIKLRHRAMGRSDP